MRSRLRKRDCENRNEFSIQHVWKTESDGEPELGGPWNGAQGLQVDSRSQ